MRGRRYSKQPVSVDIDSQRNTKGVDGSEVDCRFDGLNRSGQEKHYCELGEKEKPQVVAITRVDGVNAEIPDGRQWTVVGNERTVCTRFVSDDGVRIPGWKYRNVSSARVHSRVSTSLKVRMVSLVVSSFNGTGGTQRLLLDRDAR